MKIEWLPEFFSGENRIDLDKVISGEYSQVYLDMMEPLIDQVLNKSWPIILPFNDGLLQFYAVAQNERKLIELRRVLGANLGSSDTNAELPIIKEAKNSSEKVLLKYAPIGVIRISMLDAACDDLEAKQRVFDAFKRVISLYKQRPSLKEHVRRPVGRILRDFFTSCQLNDGKASESLFDELKISGKLSQRNLLFLRFQSLKAAQKWDEILNHNQLSNCLNGRIPIQVVRLFLEALANKYQHLINGEFSETDLEHTRQSLHKFFPLFINPPRFAELKNVKTEWKVWSVGAAITGFEDVKKWIPDDVESSWISDLLDWAEIEKQEDDGQKKTKTLPENFERLDLGKVKELLQTALFATREDTKKIVARLSKMPGHVSESLKKISNLNDHWINLQKNLSRQDFGWIQWFTDICEKEDQIDELRQLAIQDCMEWSIDTFDSKTIQANLEKSSSDKIGEAIRDVIPLMLEWLNDRDIKCSDLFWVKVLELLALDDFTNKQDVQLSGCILERVLSGSCSIENYKNALQAIEMLLDKVSSTQSYGSLLELMDLILDNACPSPDAQKSLWLIIQQFAISKWRRLDPLLRKLTIFSAREVLGTGIEDAFQDDFEQKHPEEEQKDRYPDLSGKVVAIYSLTEGASIRAKQILEGIFPGIEIRLNHDHVATVSLKNLAKTAEYFIFAAKSAKHQAFFTVKDLRDEIIYPKGKGASSIVREFVSNVRATDI